jgi:hypothetical protein
MEPTGPRHEPRISLRAVRARATRLARGRSEARPRPGPSALPPTRVHPAEPLADAALAPFPIHDVKQRSLLRSRRVSAPGFPAFLSSHQPPPTRGGRSAGRRYPHSARSRKGAHHVCETRPSGANRNGPLGAPPWRFWARSPEPPGHGLRAAAGTPILAPPAGSSPETPLMSDDARYVAEARDVVNNKTQKVAITNS